MKLLGEGIHPVTGQEIPTDSALMDEKVKRCFAFINEILDEYIDLAEKVERLEADREKKTVDGRYLGYLEELGIPYIFAGKDEIDVRLALHKLKTRVGCQRLLLEGGSILNGAFPLADAVDRLSLVVAPLVAEKDDKPLFWESRVTGFLLTSVERKKGNLLLLLEKDG